MAFRRFHVSTLIQRLSERPTFIHALFGPHQTGKNTIVRQTLSQIDPPARYLAVDEPDPAGLGAAPYDGNARVAPEPDTRDTSGPRTADRHGRDAFSSSFRPARVPSSAVVAGQMDVGESPC